MMHRSETMVSLYLLSKRSYPSHHWLLGMGSQAYKGEGLLLFVPPSERCVSTRSEGRMHIQHTGLETTGVGLHIIVEVILELCMSSLNVEVIFEY